MSFSYEIKEDLSKITNYKNRKLLESECFGYLLTGNTRYVDDYVEYYTENEFIIEKFYKILFNLEIEYEPNIKGKEYIAKIKKEAINHLMVFKYDIDMQEEKSIVRGCFLGAGNITNPSKGYHLEIVFNDKNNAEYVMTICQKYDISFKIIESKNKYLIYLKDSENISVFLALIESNKGVLAFEDVRLTKEVKNKINRLVNCETANLNKTVNAAVDQINDIKFLKKIKRFDELSYELREIALLRLENPDISLKELGQLLEKPISKSGVNHRMQKIHEIADEYRNDG